MNVSVPRSLLIQQLLECSSTAAKMAAQLSSDDPGYQDYRDACARFKGTYEFALSRFGSVIRAARARDEDGDGMSMAPGEQEKPSEQEKEFQIDGAQLEKERDELDSLMDKLAYLEEVLPDVEDRILRRLEDRLGMFKGTHPIYATLCSVLARRLAATITEDVEERVYRSIKRRLREDLQDDFYICVKERVAPAAEKDDVRDGRTRFRHVKEEEL
ncbi:hypothetical protein OH76DRAFT_1487848 [Lentinus brumalis]|uniref:Uncharacterized protein n=1 Tax=Lentinus brumalis TaxID=2498619 RepID=A0A371CT45_9APHY|nr:hypothetical protein OH76DRAFT_1487848 [Polyporus brumalis]